MSDLLFSDQILPPFSKIVNKNIQSTIQEIINSNLLTIKSLKKIKNKNWNNFVIIIEHLSVRLSNAWSPVSHLNSVLSSDELRDIYESTLPHLISYGLELEQDKELFQGYIDVLEQNDLDSKQKKLINNKLRDFRLSGVDLPEDKKVKLKALSTELSVLASKFTNNVLDCTDKWSYYTDDENILAGIPQEILDAAHSEALAMDNTKTGWLFGLDQSTYITILKYAKSSKLRSAFHFAYSTRASKNGPHDEKYDNSTLMFDILSKRHSLAKLLGYSNYAEYSLATKMVKKPEEVIDFLTTLLEKIQDYSKKDFDDIASFAKKLDNIDELRPWDISYYSELLKSKLYNLNDNELKQYFPLKKVLNGFIEIINRLYNIKLVIKDNKDNKLSLWHTDAFCMDIISNDNKTLIGNLYLDLFSRKKKRNGAWMDECRVKIQTTNFEQIPVAYLTCNFAKSTNEDINSSLLTHTDVITLFHEFGHCLHHLLTEITYPSISGINGVPWDGVELPSQFHENWCWHKDSIALISEHNNTREVLPQDYLIALKKQKNFQSGLFLLRQLIFALYDMRLHMEFHPDKGEAQINQLLSEIREKYSVIPFAEYDQFQNSFSHIFAGGYAAGYYSYLWAENLAANCFNKFRGNIFDNKVSAQFLDIILSKGGSIDLQHAVEQFCGGKLSIKPLLESHGIQ